MNEDDDRVRAGMDRRSLLQRAGVGGLALAAPTLLVGSGEVASAASSAKTGGTLKVAVNFTASHVLDPQAVAPTSVDIARNFAVFQRLFTPKANGPGYDGVLARSIESNATATRWDIHLRDGVNWQDGTPFTADDVVYSLKRMLTKKLQLEGFTTLSMVNAAGIKKLDRLTVRVPLKFPYADFQAQLADRMILMIKSGTKSFKKLNGTGPFRFVSVTPGQKYVLERNPKYWRSGRPYLDRLELINLPDATAQVNALTTGAVDVLEFLDPANARIIAANSKLQVLTSNSGAWYPFVMDMASAPFDNPDVRKAVRLLANRPQLLQVAQGGKGKLGNDLFSPFDPAYASDLPQRKYDPEQAKSLLAKAGVDKLVLDTGDVGSGILPASLAFAQSCKEAGVACETPVTPADSYWDTIWAKKPFFVSGTSNRSFASTYAIILAPNAAQPETHWNDPASHKIFQQAMRTGDEAKRNDLLGEVQRALYDKGGYVIWGFSTFVSGARASVKGIKSNVNRQLGDFNFEGVTNSA